MALLLYINGQLADVDAGTVIAQTKQVNDLNSLDNRQAGYTNKFSLPKTANNLRIMQFLTLVGNNSAVPYQKNDCSLYSASGECFVYNGWAVITDGGDSYEAVVYDGIIELYKAIENKTLNDVGLEELVHNKSVQGVINSWGANVPYRYILADYNGNNGQYETGSNRVNIDYLVPSVSVAWLWKKIFERYNNNVQPTGSIFDSPDFKQLYMTFPKGQVRSDTNDIPLFKSSDYHFIQSNGNNFGIRKIYYCKFITTEQYQPMWLSNVGGIHLKVVASASYKLTIKGKLYGHRDGNAGIHKDSFIRFGKNCDTLQAYQTGNNIINVFNGQPYLAYGEDFEFTSNPFQLSATDSICAIIGGQGTDSYELNEDWYADELTIELVRLDPESIDFSEVLTDFAVKDFLNEVVHRFGLTMYKDTFSNNYRFLTLQEQLQGAAVVNWSKKFSKKTQENYIFGTYAQNNRFTYTYNDKESTHNDWGINIANVNLPDTRDVIKSKIYSPERVPTVYLGENSNVYKLWEKEIAEDPQPDEPAITYKSLDKRYYFLKSRQVSRTINVVSDILGSLNNPTNTHYRETYSGLSFKDIISRFYSPLQALLNNAVLVTADLWLTDADIANLDFTKLYYIEQLANYYILNKVNNYISGRVTKCELVQVAYSTPPPEVIPVIFTLTGIARTGGLRAILYFTRAIENYPCVIEHSSDGISWVSYSTTSENLSSPYTTTRLAGGTNYFRISSYDYANSSVIRYSNTVSIAIP
ncbi:hypothetical protein Q765_15015 [Flavobacterium rivuli WB 3.3-2 = DSM 21788]|uniref:Uncharacterized protein n=1 Tax=Flavobacterium rivuli WB 3.3-2 = DSM 21788 TaxID=1121895 RepID=A0A0A2LZF0_9FLAO|nr:hypothetical protein [Flavobacterium rivuli]KGO85727.1 hypothetical protein Q765_15015 [Flavobacterium rivuli WB 3.3-2 = DSM 21788]